MSYAVLPRRRPVPWLFVGLAASLILNAFFLGAIATDGFRFLFATQRPVSFELRWLADRLSEEDFAAVEAAVAARRGDVQVHIERLRALRGELGALVAVDDPDRDAIDEKLVAIRDEQRAMISALQETIVDAVLALPPSDRALLAGPPRTQ